MDTAEQLKLMRAGRAWGSVELESVLTTAELARRVGRAPDYQAENQALLMLAQTLAHSPHTVLQTLCERTLSLCRAQSAGISILEEGDGESLFRWRALAGEMASYLGGITPPDFAPCGITIERDAAQLFTHPGRYYPYAAAILPPISELLLIPFHVDNKPVGTLWVTSQRENAEFDQEDVRLLKSLSDFAAAAWRVSLAQDASAQANRSLYAHVEEIDALNVRLKRAMAETHHRVKNNLQMISAMIEMQMQEHRAEQTVPIEEFAQLKTHIHTLAIVHDLLTKSVKEAEADQRVSTQAVLDQLLPMLHQTAWNREVRFTVEEARLTAKQCIALSLILNELVTNAIKHGNQEAEVVFWVEGEQAILDVSDDGPGFPAGFDPMQAANMGLELVESLVRTDLKGRSRYESKPQGGGHVRVSFPLPPLEA